MEEQSGREFASADPTAGAQDATLQERRLSPEVPLNPRRRVQHFPRPTPSHISSISPRATRRSDDHVARGRRGGLKIRKRRSLAPSHGNVTAPLPPLATLLGGGPTWDSAVAPTLEKYRQENPDYEIVFHPGHEYGSCDDQPIKVNCKYRFEGHSAGCQDGTECFIDWVCKFLSLPDRCSRTWSIEDLLL